MKNITIISLLIFSSLSFGQGRVDGFLKGKGNLDIGLGASFDAGPKYYAGDNLVQSGLGRNVVSTSVFIAYGIVDNLDVNISLPIVSVNGSSAGLQDPAIFLKYKLFRITNIHPNIVMDVIMAGGFSSNITNYTTQSLNAIGQQAKVIDVRPVLQIMNVSTGIFVTLQGGYNYKFDPVPDAAVFAVKLGIAKAKWYADLWYDSQYANGGFDYQGNPSPPTFRHLGVSFHKIGGTFYKPLTNSFGAFTGVSYVLTGRNMSKGLGGNIGIVYKPNLKK